MPIWRPMVPEPITAMFCTVFAVFAFAAFTMLTCPGSPGCACQEGRRALGLVLGGVEQRLRQSLQQQAGALVGVRPGDEGLLPGAGEHHRLHRRVVLPGIEHRRDLGEDGTGQRIALLRPVHGDHAGAVRDLGENGLEVPSRECLYFAPPSCAPGAWNAPTPVIDRPRVRRWTSSVPS